MLVLLVANLLADKGETRTLALERKKKKNKKNRRLAERICHCHAVRGSELDVF